MTKSISNPYSASQQGLGYIYQARFALLRLLQLPESNSILIEKDDDLDFLDNNGVKTLASLKHKAVGDRLTDLSIDFWKSIRIWLTHYNSKGRIESNLRFFLFTTATVSEGSFLLNFLPDAQQPSSLSVLAENAISKSTAQMITPIGIEFNNLNDKEKEDFLSRIVIFHNESRIDNLPELIMDQHMRTVRREFRNSVFQRLEGWWNDQIINLLCGKRVDAIYGYEVSDKLSAFAEEYKADNLPITYFGKQPAGEIDAENDTRLFVIQLREIGISTNRIQNAILDYYRAFEQRSAWARENLLVTGEMEEYEDRLVDEWSRYKEVVFEDLGEECAETALIEAGKALYKWAEFESSHIKIRERVTEPYVVRGGFHILANTQPIPRVYWHPHFLSRINVLLKVSSL